MTDGIVEQFLDSLGHPVQSSSRFYAYYYLTEFQGAVREERKFSNIRDRLFQDFWYYGGYSVARELVHSKPYAETTVGDLRDAYQELFGRELEIRGPTQWSDGETVPLFWKNIRGSSKIVNRVGERIINNKLKGEVEINNPGEMVVSIMEARKQVGIIAPDDSIKDFFGKVDDLAHIVDNSRQLFELGERMFSDFDWAGNFGGENWAGICRALLLRGEMTRSSWVDAMWGLQHNTGAWINKVPIRNNNEYYKDIIEIAGEGEIPDGLEVDGNDIEEVRNDEMLQYVLDKKRESEFDDLWPLMAAADRQLMKYKTLLTEI